MPSRQARKNLQALRKEIGSVTDALNGYAVTDPEYKPTLKILIKLQQQEANYIAKNPLEARDLIGPAATVLCVAIMVIFESNGHSITTKALQFVKPTKLG